MRISRRWLEFSVLAGVLMGWASFRGIYERSAYLNETLNWASQAMAQDYTNLYLAMPALLVSAYFVHKGSLRAYLVWLGILIYTMYSYFLYAFFIHFGPNFLTYVAILGLSFYAIAGSLLDFSWDEFRDHVTGVKTRYPQILLLVIGVMFYYLWLSDIFRALSSGMLPGDLAETGLVVNPVHVLDMAFILPGAALTAIALGRRNIMGYLFAVPLMVFFALMGVAILAIFRVTAELGISTEAPPGGFMEIIVLLNLALSYRFLRQVKEDRTQADGGSSE
jgi:hypothetical protein